MFQSERSRIVSAQPGLVGRLNMESEDRLNRFKSNPFYRPLPSGTKKESSIPADAPIWGEVYVDQTGLDINFRFHVDEGVGFNKARATLRKFIIIMQQRLDNAPDCPFYEEEINALATRRGDL